MILLLLVLVDLFVFAGLLATTFNWLLTDFTPSVSFAVRSASVFATAVSTVPRSVTTPLTTSTLIFLSGVFELLGPDHGGQGDVFRRRERQLEKRKGLRNRYGRRERDT